MKKLLLLKNYVNQLAQKQFFLKAGEKAVKEQQNLHVQL